MSYWQNVKDCPELWLLRISIAILLLPLIVAGFAAYLFFDGLKRGWEIGDVITLALAEWKSK